MKPYEIDPSPVRGGPELERILKLESGQEPSDRELEAVENALRKEGSDARLTDGQRATLYHIFVHRRLSAIVPVGQGKSLVSLLAGTLLGARRPVLLIMADLKTDFLLERDKWVQHWEINMPTLLTYTKVSRDKDALDKLDPDLLIADEVHKISNPKSAVAKRVKRFLQKNPKVPFLNMTGSAINHSVEKYADILGHTLGDKSPLPRTYREKREWHGALAPGSIKGLGALRAFGINRQAVRQEVQTRIRAANGVHISDGVFEGPLTLILEDAPVSISAQEHIRTLARDSILPDGLYAESPAHEALMMDQLSLGFYYTWRKAPPTDWLEARRTWSKDCRELIAAGHGDSREEIEKKIRDGEIASEPAYWAWQEIKGKFRGDRTHVWLEGVDHGPAPKNTLVWAPFSAYGRGLAKSWGVPYYGRKGMSSEGKFIGLSEPSTVVASIKANFTGRNLPQWSENILQTPVVSAMIWEQLIGRTHRTGQKKEVIVRVRFRLSHHWQGWVKTMQDMEAGLSEKLKRAVIIDRRRKRNGRKETTETTKG